MRKPTVHCSDKAPLIDRKIFNRSHLESLHHGINRIRADYICAIMNNMPCPLQNSIYLSSFPPNRKAKFPSATPCQPIYPDHITRSRPLHTYRKMEFKNKHKHKHKQHASRRIQKPKHTHTHTKKMKILPLSIHSNHLSPSQAPIPGQGNSHLSYS